MWTIVTYSIDGTRDGATFDDKPTAKRYMAEELRYEDVDSCELHDPDGLMVEHVVGAFTDC